MTMSRTKRATLVGGLATALAVSFTAIAIPASADEVEYVAPQLITHGNPIATDQQIVCPGEGEVAGVTMSFDVQTGSVAPVNFTWGIVGSETTNTLTEANRLYEARGDFIATDATSYTISITVDDGVGEPITSTQQVTCEVAPPTPTVVQIRTESYCIDGTTPAGEVRVTVNVPEGAEPADLGVVYGNEESLGGIVQVSATGEYPFQGVLPVGLTDFTVVLNGFAAGEGTIAVKTCEENANPGGDGGDNGGTTNPGTTPGTSNPGTNSGTDDVVVPGSIPGTGDVVKADAASAQSFGTVNGWVLGGSIVSTFLVLVIAYVLYRRHGDLSGRFGN